MKFIVIILGLILSSFDCYGLSQVQTEKNENKQFFYAINIAEDDMSQQDVSKYIPLEAKENIFENNSRMFLIFEKTSENVSMEIDKLLDKYQRSGYSETSINRFRFLKQKANYESFYRVKTPAISDSDHVKRDTNNQIIYIKYGENTVPKCICIECDYLYKTISFADSSSGVKQLVVASANML